MRANKTQLTRERAAEIVEEFLVGVQDLPPAIMRAWKLVKDQPWLIDAPSDAPQRSDPGWRALGDKATQTSNGGER